MTTTLQADPSKPVLVAGDPERTHVEKVKKEGGITYHVNQIKDSVSMSDNYDKFYIYSCIFAME